MASHNVCSRFLIKKSSTVKIKDEDNFRLIYYDDGGGGCGGGDGLNSGFLYVFCGIQLIITILP